MGDSILLTFTYGFDVFVPKHIYPQIPILENSAEMCMYSVLVLYILQINLF